MSVPATELEAEAAVTFQVLGTPVPQGSKSAFVVKGRAVVTERSRAALGPWRGQIAAVAAEHVSEPLTGPVEVELVFALVRPKSHYRSGARAGELRDGAPAFVSGRPDVDKLARAVLDGLTGVAFRDDSQVAVLHCRKLYSTTPGVLVRLRELERGR